VECSASGCRLIVSRAACRAKRRTRPVSASETGLTFFVLFGRVGTMSARTWGQGGDPRYGAIESIFVGAERRFGCPSFGLQKNQVKAGYPLACLPLPKNE
jgi:hypothetical protein